MISGKPLITTDVAELDTTQSDIYKKLTIIKTEAWFNTVQAIAIEHHDTAKLESRFMKTVIICVAKPCRQAYRNYRRIGRIWHLDEAMSIFWHKR